MKVAITGANGFVGRALVSHLERSGAEVRRLVRRQGSPDEIEIGDLGGNPTHLAAALQGVETVVHLAARAHILNDRSVDARSAIRASNVIATHQLAAAADAAGARRFVFLSSVKVHGEATELGFPFRDDSPFDPGDAYAASKAEAEQALSSFHTDMDIVTLRPPLVYGPGVKANFLQLVNAVQRGLPLPLGWVVNERSLLGLDNLCSAIAAVINHPDRLSRPFLLSDGPPISTPALIRTIAFVLGKRANLLPFPVRMLRLAARIVARGPMVDRLCDSLAVDDLPFREQLGWRPVSDLETGLRQMIKLRRP